MKLNLIAMSRSVQIYHRFSSASYIVGVPGPGPPIFFAMFHMNIVMKKHIM